MNASMVNIVDLPDEILLTIFKKIHHIDVLFSLVGVNQKLDKVACDVDFTQSLNLIIKSSNEDIDCNTTDAILNRFCNDILPRIYNQVECLTVQGDSFHSIIHSSNYPNLHKLVLVNLKLTTVSDIFNGMLS